MQLHGIVAVIAVTVDDVALGAVAVRFFVGANSVGAVIAANMAVVMDVALSASAVAVYELLWVLLLRVLLLWEPVRAD